MKVTHIYKTRTKKVQTPTKAKQEIQEVNLYLIYVQLLHQHSHDLNSKKTCLMQMLETTVYINISVSLQLWLSMLGFPSAVQGFIILNFI